MVQAKRLGNRGFQRGAVAQSDLFLMPENVKSKKITLQIIVNLLTKWILGYICEIEENYCFICVGEMQYVEAEHQISKVQT